MSNLEFIEKCFEIIKVAEQKSIKYILYISPSFADINFGLEALGFKKPPLKETYVSAKLEGCSENLDTILKELEDL